MPYERTFYLFKDDNVIALEFALQNLKLKDLNIEVCGMQECQRDQQWGYGIRHCYFIHYVISGEGIFKNSYGTYKLKAGMGFIFLPGEKVFYQADRDNPWHFIWIGFSGEKVSEFLKRCEFDSENPIFTFDENFDILNFFAEAEHIENGREFYLLSVLYKFFYLNDKNNVANLSKIELAKNYIINNFSNNISVEMVADNIFINRKHFSRIFKKSVGLTPQQYIRNVRMSQALKLLKTTDLSVTDVAFSVGYNDISTFSKAFKKTYNVSPTDVMNGMYPSNDTIF